MSFDPISHASGYGAGQQAERRNTDAAEARARQAEISAESSHANAMMIAVALGQERKKTASLQDALDNRWIPYAVHLEASIQAHHLEKQILTDALKRLDPHNAGIIIQNAADAQQSGYDALTRRDSPERAKIYQMAEQESERHRLSKIAQDEMSQAIEKRRLYRLGEKLPFDWYEAFSLWAPLAEAGDAKAQFNVGRCYSLGNGVGKDETKAVEWFMKAAAQGEPRAHYNLHLHYYEHKDAARADEWLTKAAELGEPRACCDIATDLMFAGDKIKAKTLFKRAFDAGDERAKLGLVACDINISISMGKAKTSTGKRPAVVFRVENTSPAPALVSVWLAKYDQDNPERKIGDSIRLDLPILQAGEVHEETYVTQDERVRIYWTACTIWDGGVHGDNWYNLPLPKKLLVWEWEKKGCFILTACYGDHDAPTVMQYRQFRDNYLLNNQYGRKFISWYYTHGPRWAEVLDGMPRTKAVLRVFFKLAARLLPR